MAAEHGVVALDPMALARLEGTLHGVADVYRSQAWQITEVMAGTGESVMDELADLRRVTAWSERQRDDISRRRSILDDLPIALPLPIWRFTNRDEARQAAEVLVSGLLRTLEHESPSWTTLARLLDELERGNHDGAFAARVLTLLGPELMASLPLRIEQAAREGGGAERSGTGDEVQAIVAETLLVGSRFTGSGRLPEDWAVRFAGLDERGVASADSDPEVRARLEGLGFGVDLARAVALGLEAGTVATVLGGADKVLAVARMGAGDADGWDVAGTGVGLVGSLGMLLVSTGVVAAPLGVAAVLGGSVVASALAWFMSQVEAPPEEQATPENRRRRHTRSYDPDTGTYRFPGGGTDQPHQDGAGGVLPPNMIR